LPEGQAFRLAKPAELARSPWQQRPPIRDGDDSGIGRDRHKKALAVPVDGVGTVVADDPELFPK
jgi:hypothetical protein